MSTRHHWDEVYRGKPPQSVSWYRLHLETSLGLIVKAAPQHDASIIDVGGGASTLIDDLLAAGYRNLTVLDVSQTAVDVAKQRLRSGLLRCPVDHRRYSELRIAFQRVRHLARPRHFSFPHRRRPALRLRSPGRACRQARRHVLIGTFGPEGPTKCSGLDVVRYDAASLHSEFGIRFHLFYSVKELHQTPFDTTQQFLYCLCRVE